MAFRMLLYDKWGRAYDDESNEDAVRPLMFVAFSLFPDIR